MAEVRTPDQVRAIINEIDLNSNLRIGMHAMMDRGGEMGSPLAAKLVGIGMHAPSRAHFNKRLDQWWSSSPALDRIRGKGIVDEVVLGAGLHAAIYCAIRHRMGAPKPLVLEGKDRVGGAFAYSLEPSFYLNSRNRPGKLGTPGRGEALNFIPGGIFQPVDLDCDEYQTNAALAFTIRASLAMYANVVPSTYAEAWTRNYDGYFNIELRDRPIISTKRLIIATGLGETKVSSINLINKGGLFDYPTFLSRFDKPFPLRGMKKVAVIGAGDSGKTCVEALLGQGPYSGMSPGSMDFPEKIDWYKVDPDESSREGFIKCNRSRYQGIARALPREGQSADQARIAPISRRPNYFELTYNGVFVDGAFYDAAILCTGFRAPYVSRDAQQRNNHSINGRIVARKPQDQEVYYIGPAAQIEAEARSNVPADVPENNVAVFRYADRTAALAMSLPVDQFRKLSPAQREKFFSDIRVTPDLAPIPA